MILYICESPQKAGHFAKALQATSKGEGFFYNSSVKITWAIGHLITLAMPEQYDPAMAQWNIEHLPILPTTFKLMVSPGMSKQFNIVKKLLNEADQIICATDSDREGDLIFHYIYSLAGIKKPYHRVLPNDLTVNGIKKTVSKVIEPRKMVIHSAESRSRADWLIGINGTRALTLSANRKISIGRVQTPTLALICQRFLENQNFVATPYFPVTIELTKDGCTFKARLKELPADENAAREIAQNSESISTCIESTQVEAIDKQPIPYDLGALQIDASKSFGLSPKQTLDISQKLYERHKLITYPRTDSGYLTEELFVNVPERLKSVTKLVSSKEAADIFDFDNLPKRCVDDKKAPNHQGIIPTDELSAYQDLDAKEKQLFDLITLRFMAAFAPECIKQRTTYEFENNQAIFQSSGTVILSPGWKDLLDTEDPEDDQSESQQSLPAVEQGDQLQTANSTYEKKMTKPPALLTHSSLVKLMISCGKKLDDAALRKAMVENELRTGGLGTSATRGEIIENVFESGLITQEKGKIIPTEMGLSLYNLIKEKDLSKPELTANLQLKLDMIASGEYDHINFMNEIQDYTRTVTSDLLEIGSQVETDNIKLECPKCKSGKIIEGKKGFGCSQWKEGCDFVIWKKMSGKNLDLSVIREIIVDGTTSKTISGFKKKDGNGTFKAKLSLDDQFKVVFDFSTSDKTGNEIHCPHCKNGPITTNDHGAFCGSCELKIWRKMAGKKLTDSQLIQLLTKGKTSKIKGFKSKKDKPFDAVVTLEGTTTKFNFD